MPANLSREEFMALGAIAKARRDNLSRVFKGTRLTFGKFDATEGGLKVTKYGRKLYACFKKTKDTAKQADTSALVTQAKDFITTCADVENIDDVAEAITSAALQELIGEVIPFVGIAWSSYKATSATKNAIKQGRQLAKMDDYKGSVRMGDPLAAADGVETILRRRIAKETASATRHAASAGTKIAGLFADLGTSTTVAVGIGSAAIGLSMELYRLGTDVKEMRAGNKRLKTPETLDLSVFESAPILGCYLLTCSDTSMVANFFVADIGLPGWMDKIEQLKKKKLDKLLEIASKNIEKSRLQLDGIQPNKGVPRSKSFFSRIRKLASNVAS